MYLAVSRTPASVDVAVERDLPILTSFSMPEADNLALMSLYSDRCAAAGKTAVSWRKCPTFGSWYLDEERKRRPGNTPAGPLTWVRDLGGYRRTLTHGDEINVDLDHWRRVRTVEPAQLRVGTGNHLLLRHSGLVRGADC